MTHFTEEQLQELEAIFGLKREESLPVRDGRVHKTTLVWWRNQTCPEQVVAEDHWPNIQGYLEAYSIARPRIIYQD